MSLAATGAGTIPGSDVTSKGIMGKIVVEDWAMQTVEEGPISIEWALMKCPLDLPVPRYTG